MISKQGEALKQILQSPPSEIPEFNIEVFRDAKKRCTEIMQELKELAKMKIDSQNMDPDNKQKQVWRRIKVTTLYEEYARLKRFMLIYLDSRSQKIQNQFWNFAGDIKHDQHPNLLQHEKKALVSYKQLIANYSRSTGFPLLEYLQPPTSLYQEVRVQEDCGEIVDENGETIRLEKGSVHFLPRKIAQSLILQGYLTLIR